ncbi:MAG: PIN domain-containing protein [Chloroflexota bacterium]|nr:PIN domain-containing protein [Chloroflexota bacterium]
MKAGEAVFLDTNILVYAVEEDNPLHNKATDLINRVITGELAICLSPQVIGEMYATITNPRRIKKVCRPDQAVDIAESIWNSNAILKIFARRQTLDLTLRIVKRLQLESADFFDAQIAATMLDNGITTIYTVNEKDFALFEEITAINPFRADQ